jgi:prophage regulatory protein
MFESVETQNNLVGRVIPLTRLLRKPEVLTLTGIGQTTLHKLISEGSFPKPVPITGKVVGWVDSEIQKWIASRINLRD